MKYRSTRYNGDLSCPDYIVIPSSSRYFPLRAFPRTDVRGPLPAATSNPYPDPMIDFSTLHSHDETMQRCLTANQTSLDPLLPFDQIGLVFVSAPSGTIDGSCAASCTQHAFWKHDIHAYMILCWSSLGQSDSAVDSLGQSGGWMGLVLL